MMTHTFSKVRKILPLIKVKKKCPRNQFKANMLIKVIPHRPVMRRLLQNGLHLRQTKDKTKKRLGQVND